MAFTKKVVAGQTIAAADFAKFFGDHFSEFVKTGFEVTEGTGLVVDISAGTAYVKDASGYMYQIVSGATETTTLADDSTNYVFLHSDNGATYITDSTSATVPDDAILLATVVTASGDVSTVTDGRVMTPLTTQEHYSEYPKSVSISVSTNPTTSSALNCRLNVFSDKTLNVQKVRYTITATGTGDDFVVYYSFDDSSYTTLRTITNIGGASATYTDTINDSASSTSGELYFKFTQTGGNAGTKTLTINQVSYYT